MAELMAAIHSGNVKLVDNICFRLVAEKSKYELDAIDNEERITPLSLACKLNNEDMVSTLLGYGAAPNVITTIRNKCKAPLHFIGEVQGGNVEIVSRLLSSGADVNLETSDSQTSLHLACSVGNYDIAKTLLENSAFVDVVDNSGNIPLTEACYLENHALLQLLVGYGSDINNRDGMQQVHPLSIVIQRHWIAGLKYLLSQGVDMKKEDFVSDAVLQGQEGYGTLQLLLLAGAEVNATSSLFEFTPLHQACMSSRATWNSIELLLCHGAEVNKQSKAQNTALHYASQNMDLQNIKILLLNGADPHVRNRRGMTPLEVGFTSGSHLETFRLFLEMFAAFGAKISKKMGENLRSNSNLYTSLEIQEIGSLVTAFSCNALPLLQLARIRIRSCVNSGEKEDIEKLSELLPPALIRYLMFEDFDVEI